MNTLLSRSLLVLGAAGLIAGCGGVSSDTGTVFNPNARTPALIKYEISGVAGAITDSSTCQIIDQFSNIYDDLDGVNTSFSFAPINVVDPPSTGTGLDFNCVVYMDGGNAGQSAFGVSISADAYED